MMKFMSNAHAKVTQMEEKFFNFAFNLVIFFDIFTRQSKV